MYCNTRTIFSTRSVPRCYKEGPLASRQRRCYIRTMTASVQLQKKKISSSEPQEARREDELIGGKPPVVE
jgi:hypothetical protein